MITVLTPTYNREHTLKRLFDSLKLQTVQSFEWVLVDDGSTDSTAGLVRGFERDANFPVSYITQANSGKHVAVNTGVRQAKGDWVFIVDSDDALPSRAIETLARDIREFASDDLAGLCYRRRFFDGGLVGVQVSGDDAPRFLHPTDASMQFKGDLAYVFRTSALLRHPFPVIEGERFVPELYIWNQIGDEGKILFFSNVAIYLCEYLADGYSENFASNLRRNPRGFGLFYRAQFFREKSFVRRVTNAIRAMQCLFFAYCSRSH